MIETAFDYYITEIRVADIDDDNDQDIILSERGIHIISNNDNLSFELSEGWNWKYNEPVSFEIADFDSEGSLDILQLSEGYHHYGGTIFVDENDGYGNLNKFCSGSFCNEYQCILFTHSGGGYLDDDNQRAPREIAVGDFNADGKPDVALASEILIGTDGYGDGLYSGGLDVMYNVGNHDHDSYGGSLAHNYNDSVFQQNRFSRFFYTGGESTLAHLSVGSIDDIPGDDIIAVRGNGSTPSLMWWNGNGGAPHFIAGFFYWDTSYT